MKRCLCLAAFLWGCGNDLASEGTSSTGNALSARALTESGEPAKGDTAYLRGDTATAGAVQIALVGSDGRVGFDGIQPGAWTFEVRGKSRGRIFRLRFGTRDRIDLGTFALPGLATISGRILTPAGTGPCSVFLPGTGLGTSTDSLGNFVVGGVSMGNQRVLAEPRIDGSLGSARWDSLDVRDTGHLVLPAKPAIKRVSSGAWTLAWSDEFDRLDTARWTRDTGDGCAEGLCKWGNDFLQSYQAKNASVDAGTLVLRAERIAGKWVSGSVQSRAKSEWSYGRMEVRARIASANGSWTILSLQGDTAGGPAWPASGAVDIASVMGIHPDSLLEIGHRTLPDGTGQHAEASVYSASNWTDRWVDFAVEWSPDEIVFLADDQVYHRVAGGPPFDHPFYWALTLAVGGNGNQPPDSLQGPFETRIDRIRVYQKTH